MLLIVTKKNVVKNSENVVEQKKNISNLLPEMYPLPYEYMPAARPPISHLVRCIVR